MRLKWDNVGKGLSAVAEAVQSRRITDAIRRGQEQAKLEAERSGGEVYLGTDEEAKQAFGLSDVGAVQGDILVRQNREFGNDSGLAMRQTQDAMASANGWTGTQGDYDRAREATTQRARAYDARVNPDLSAAYLGNPDVTPRADATPALALRSSDGLRTYAMGERPAAPLVAEPTQGAPAVDPRLKTDPTLSQPVEHVPGVTGVRHMGAPLPSTTVMQDPTNLNAVPSNDTGMRGIDPNRPAARPEDTPREMSTLKTVQKGKVDWEDIYHKKYMPEVVSKLIEQGKIQEAEAYENWSTSRQGKRYGADWMKGYDMVAKGDYNGAMSHIQNLYNKQLPDGQYAIVVPGKDGNYSVDVYKEGDNRKLHSHTGKAQDIATRALGMMTPDAVAKYVLGQQADAAKDAKDLAKEERAHERAVALKRMEADNREPKFEVFGRYKARYTPGAPADTARGIPADYTYAGDAAISPLGEIGLALRQNEIAYRRAQDDEARAERAAQSREAAQAEAIAKAEVESGTVQRNRKGQWVRSGIPVPPTQARIYDQFYRQVAPPAPGSGLSALLGKPPPK